MSKTFYWIFGLGMVPFLVLGVLAAGYAVLNGHLSAAIAVTGVILLLGVLLAALLGSIAWAMRNGGGRLSPEERERLRAKFRARSAAPADGRSPVSWLFLVCSLAATSLLLVWILQGGFRLEAPLFLPGVAITLYVIYLGSRERGWESRPRSRGIVGPIPTTAEIKPCRAFRWFAGK